jgi:lactoylglutathione lyase
MTSPVVSRTGHVGLNVSDLDRSLEFYTDIFGLGIRMRSDDPGRRFAFLAGDDAPVLTLWEQCDRDFSATTAGLHHLCFQVDSPTEVHAIEQRLRARGAPIFHDQIVAHREGAGSGGVFFADPDGIRLEVSGPGAGDGAPAPSGTAPTCGFF